MVQRASPRQWQIHSTLQLNVPFIFPPFFTLPPLKHNLLTSMPQHSTSGYCQVLLPSALPRCGSPQPPPPPPSNPCHSWLGPLAPSNLLMLSRQLYHFPCVTWCGKVLSAILEHNRSCGPCCSQEWMALRVTKLYLGTGALWSPVILVISSKPSSTLSYFTVWQPVMMRTGQGHRHRGHTSHQLPSKEPSRMLARWLCACFSCTVSLSCFQTPLGSIHTRQLFFRTKGLFNYFKIFFNHTFFPNNEDG